MTKSSKALAAEVEAVNSSSAVDLVALREESAILEELEETGIMGGWCEQDEDAEEV